VPNRFQFKSIFLIKNLVQFAMDLKLVKSPPDSLMCSFNILVCLTYLKRKVMSPL